MNHHKYSNETTRQMIFYFHVNSQPAREILLRMILLATLNIPNFSNLHRRELIVRFHRNAPCLQKNHLKLQKLRLRFQRNFLRIPKNHQTRKYRLRFCEYYLKLCKLSARLQKHYLLLHRSEKMLQSWSR